MAAEPGNARDDQARANRSSREVADAATNHFVFDSPLHKAAYAGELRRVKSILQRNKHIDYVNINSRNRLGCTALRLAATAGHTDCVRLLIRHGADVNVSDIKAQTPLFVAVKNRHLECVQVLLDAGADPDGDPYSLCSPVYIAAMDGFTDGLKALLDSGADPDVSLLRVGWFNSTPLYVSIAYHHYSCLKVLLLAGAEPDRIPTGISPTGPTAYNQVMTLTRRPSLSVMPHPLSLTRSMASQDDSSLRSNSQSTEMNNSVSASQVGSPQNNPPNMETLALPPIPPPLLAPPFRPRISNSHTCQSLYDATVKHNVETEYVQLLYDFGASLYRCIIYRRPDVDGVEIRSLGGDDRPLGAPNRPGVLDEANDARGRANDEMGGTNVEVGGGNIEMGGVNCDMGEANVETEGSQSQPSGGVSHSVDGVSQPLGGVSQLMGGINQSASPVSVPVGVVSSLVGGVNAGTVGRGFENGGTVTVSITDRERLTLYSRDNECAQYIRQLLANPRSLMSSCRLAIRRAVGRPRLNNMSDKNLGVPSKILRYLKYEF